MNSQERLERVRTRMKELGIKRRRGNFMHLCCTECKREYKIMINTQNKELYTDEYCNSYKCILCRNRNKKHE